MVSMRHRYTAGWAFLVLCLALLLPSTALAGKDFTYTIVHQGVTTPSFGVKHYVFKVKTTEHGRGTYKMIWNAWFQHSTDTQHWTTEYHWAETINNYPNDSDSYWYQHKYTRDSTDGHWHRIKVVVKLYGFNLINVPVVKGQHTFYQDYY
jgi:hypothetical protein